jgi:hypothetical protein
MILFIARLKKLPRLRLIACSLWMLSGILTFSIPGLISAIASGIFIAAMLREMR